MNSKETEIRNLLERFYEGETSASDMSRLKELFDTWTDMPEWSARERRAYEAISSGCPDMPADVASRMIDVIDGADRRWRRRCVLHIAAVTCAAAACIAAIFIPVYDGKVSVSGDMGIIARAESVADVSGEAAARVVAAETRTEAAENRYVGPGSGVEAVRKVADDVKPQKKAVKRARIITDPDEAVRFVNGMLSDMAESLQEGELTVARAIEDQRKCEETINKILQ